MIAIVPVIFGLVVLLGGSTEMLKIDKREGVILY